MKLAVCFYFRVTSHEDILILHFMNPLNESFYDALFFFLLFFPLTESIIAGIVAAKVLVLDVIGCCICQKKMSNDIFNMNIIALNLFFIF